MGVGFVEKRLHLLRSILSAVTLQNQGLGHLGHLSLLGKADMRGSFTPSPLLFKVGRDENSKVSACCFRPR